MSDNKFGDQLRDLERAREDQWARERDERLLERLRHQQAELNCPRCNVKLVARRDGGVDVMACPDGHGGWLDHETLHSLTHGR
ncbi:MAG: zf-TFIIB domain-containing protein [Candidatus Binataceae bacterium]